MIRIRATKRLLDRLQRARLDEQDLLVSPLGDWYATVVFTRPQVALFVNELTFLPILIPLAPAESLIQRFPQAIESTLRAYGLRGDFIGEVVRGSGSVELGKTASRSLLGVMNEYVQMMRRFDFDAGNDGDRLLMAHRLAETPTSPLFSREGSPDRELMALESRWRVGGSSLQQDNRAIPSLGEVSEARIDSQNQPESFDERKTTDVPIVRDSRLKRSTAVRHLREIASAADARAAVHDVFEWPLREIWVTGDLLEPRDQLETVAVILRLAIAADAMPWLSAPPLADWVGDQLRLDRRPVAWFFRPETWPAWTPLDRRVAKIWTAEGGTNEDAIQAIAESRLADLLIEEPSDELFAQQMLTELFVSRFHLRSVLAGFFDRDWRRQHRGIEDETLWRAAQGLCDIEDSLINLEDLLTSSD